MPTAMVKSIGFAEGSLLLKDKAEEAQPLYLQTFPRLSWTELQQGCTRGWVREHTWESEGLGLEYWLRYLGPNSNSYLIGYVRIKCSNAFKGRPQCLAYSKYSINLCQSKMKQLKKAWGRQENPITMCQSPLSPSNSGTSPKDYTCVGFPWPDLKQWVYMSNCSWGTFLSCFANIFFNCKSCFSAWLHSIFYSGTQEYRLHRRLK